MVSISEPFIRRPVGTTLLSIGLFLVGMVAYLFLPVASVPNVDFPSIRVNATRPGADPSVMAATVAAPLERRLGEIAGINQLTSTSSLGSTNIQLQFNIGRDIDRAARDVQAAINASLADLPSDLPSLPRFRKVNSAAAPVFVLALTSKTISTSALYDVADTVLAQRISQVDGVGEVIVSGADQPAVRIDGRGFDGSHSLGGEACSRLHRQQRRALSQRGTHDAGNARRLRHHEGTSTPDANRCRRLRASDHRLLVSRHWLCARYSQRRWPGRLCDRRQWQQKQAAARRFRRSAHAASCRSLETLCHGPAGEE